MTLLNSHDHKLPCSCLSQSQCSITPALLRSRAPALPPFLPSALKHSPNRTHSSSIAFVIARSHTIAHPRAWAFNSRTLEVPSHRALMSTSYQTFTLPNFCSLVHPREATASPRSHVATSSRSCDSQSVRCNHQIPHSSHAETVETCLALVLSKHSTSTLSQF